MKVKDQFSIQEIKNEVQHLVDIGSLNRQQPLHNLGLFFSSGEWDLIECELETKGYSIMTNSIADLLDGLIK
ncbi:MAG: DUF4327 family protein [Cyanobacteria bacterium P01_G01_bin.19]